LSALSGLLGRAYFPGSSGGKNVSAMGLEINEWTKHRPEIIAWNFLYILGFNHLLT
jgi:hypothetical protein